MRRHSATLTQKQTQLPSHGRSLYNDFKMIVKGNYVRCEESMTILEILRRAEQGLGQRAIANGAPCAKSTVGENTKTLLRGWVNLRKSSIHDG